jgi:hypothetical protein
MSAIRLVWAFGLSAVIAWPALAQETLVCVADKSTGFSWNGSSWITSDFNTGNQKYLVKPVPEYGTDFKVNYEIRAFGSDVAKHRCFRKEGWSEVTCGGLHFWGFMLNFESLRFQEYYGVGYVDGRDSVENTPALTIGTCSKM